jgi:hypothetical protein
MGKAIEREFWLRSARESGSDLNRRRRGRSALVDGATAPYRLSVLWRSRLRFRFRAWWRTVERPALVVGAALVLAAGLPLTPTARAEITWAGEARAIPMTWSRDGTTVTLTVMPDEQACDPGDAYAMWEVRFSFVGPAVPPDSYGGISGNATVDASGRWAPFTTAVDDVLNHQPSHLLGVQMTCVRGSEPVELVPYYDLWNVDIEAPVVPPEPEPPVLVPPHLTG